MPAKASLTHVWSDVEKVDFYSANSPSLAEFEVIMHWDRSKFYACLRELIHRLKVEILLVKSVSDGSHLSIPKGTKMIFPLVYKGLLPPDIRSTEEEIETILTQMEKM